MDDEVYADMLAMLASDIGVATPSLNSPLSALNSPLSTLHSPLSTLARGEVFPTNIAPVISRDGPMAIKWGFPQWKGAGVIINARAETAAEKNMFRKPLLERRCIVPSSGFYEWRHVGGQNSRSAGQKKKEKFLLRIPGERFLFMAGIINIFKGADGNDYSAFVILTTTANESVAPIHDRMPVILAPYERDRWLRDSTFMESALHRAGPALALEIQ